MSERETESHEGEDELAGESQEAAEMGGDTEEPAEMGGEEAGELSDY